MVGRPPVELGVSKYLWTVLFFFSLLRLMVGQQDWQPAYRKLTKPLISPRTPVPLPKRLKLGLINLVHMITLRQPGVAVIFGTENQR